MINIPSYYLVILVISQAVENVSRLIYDYIIKNNQKKKESLKKTVFRTKLFVILKFKYKNEEYRIYCDNLLHCHFPYNTIYFKYFIMNLPPAYLRKKKVDILLEYDKFDQIYVNPENIERYGNTNDKTKKFRINSSVYFILFIISF